MLSVLEKGIFTCLVATVVRNVSCDGAYVDGIVCQTASVCLYRSGCYFLFRQVCFSLVKSFLVSSSRCLDENHIYQIF